MDATSTSQPTYESLPDSSDAYSSHHQAVTDKKRPHPHRYVLYGQIVDTAFRLPELETTCLADTVSKAADLRIVRDSVPEAQDTSGVNGVVRVTSEEVLLHYDLVGAFLIQGGRRVVVDASVDLSERLARHLLLGVCTGIALHQKNVLTLHASGVALDGGVAAFIGWKRRGKSTTASALYASGARLVTDDIVAIPPDDPATVLPGFPQMRLEPEAAAATINVSPESLPRLYDGYEKRIGDATQRFQQEALPLRCIYVLEWGDDFSMSRLNHREAFVQLLRHSYAQRFLGKTAATPTYFEQMNALVQEVPVVAFERPRSLDRIPRLVRCIQSHFQDL